MLQKTFCILALLLLGSTAHSADLTTVYRQAVLTNPQLAASAASLQAVREQRPQAIAGLLPTLSASGSLNRKRFKERDPSQPARFSTDKVASLDLRQPLFRYENWIQLKQSDSEIAAAEAKHAAARQDLMVLVAERYFKVLDAQDNLEFAEAEKSAIGRQLDQATQRFDVGLIAITDVKAAQARYDLSVSLEIQATSGLVEAKDALREVAGTYYDNLAPLKADLKLERPQPDSPESWIEQAKKQNLKIMAAQARTETAQQEIRRQRAGHLPTLDLSASTSYLDINFGGIAPLKREDRGIGVELNVPLYQGGLVNSRTRQARSRFQEATELLQQEIRAAELETRNAYRGVVTDIAQVKALSQSLESTKIAVEAEEAGFEVGTRTIVDVLNAQREKFLAKLNYGRARYLYVVDQLRLKKAAGILDGEDILEVNRALESVTPAPAIK
ncbi:MAG: TolC family outer membrane protein [Gammaproteobacteria bacterium]|nr:MAG: TolC family outer membrane protein [Gammaproteobacteria bacterium]